MDYFPLPDDVLVHPANQPELNRIYFVQPERFFLRWEGDLRWGCVDFAEGGRIEFLIPQAVWIEPDRH
jgi:hypothetical protein